MGLVHHLSHGFIVTSLKSVADIEDPLDLSDDIFCPEEVFFRNLFADLFEPYPLGITQEVDLGVILLDGCCGILT